MKQRFGIAQALLGEPRLIILDEPTAGLDPAERNRFYNLLSQIGENSIVILSTHIVEDVRTLCSDFAVIAQGEVLYEGRPDDAIAVADGKMYTRSIGKEEVDQYKARYNVISTQLRGGSLNVRIMSDEDPGSGFTHTPAILEDVYFNTIAGKTHALTV